MNTLFDFDDILIEPTKLSDIRSRSEIKFKYPNGKLPLMTAPMDTVISDQNLHYFIDNDIIPVLPRGVENESKNMVFTSYGLTEFQNKFIDNVVEINDTIYVLIDIANGHIREMYKIIEIAKRIYGDSLCLMVGNVANPDTFIEYARLNVDYVRIGIGNGNGCLTTVQTGVGYPMGSLIKQCRDQLHILNTHDDRNNYQFKSKTKIVADGGFKKYSDIIKALALGADYVMLGSMFNKTLESAGETIYYEKETPITIKEKIVIDQYGDESKQRFEVGLPLYKTFRGMSTKDVQKDWGRTELKTSEGIVKTQQVEYTISGWVENFQSYLKSAMSYTGKKELLQFIGGVNYNFITQNSFNRFNK